jgi:hypothetical protein
LTDREEERFKSLSERKRLQEIQDEKKRHVDKILNIRRRRRISRKSAVVRDWITKSGIFEGVRK